MLTTDAAYIAGIIDGEGSINISRHRNRKYTGARGGRLWAYQLGVAVEMYDKGPVRFIFEQTKLGQLKLAKKRKKCKLPMWRWTVSGPQAQEVLEEIRPFLLAKGEQADLAIEFQSNKNGRGEKLSDEKYSWYEQMRQELKKVRSHEDIQSERK